MKFFTQEKIIQSVKRLVYAGSPSVGTLTEVYTDLNGYLRPLSEEQAGINQVQWGLGFQLITEVGVDIRVADTVTIKDVVYTVRARADHDRGNYTSYQKYLLVRKDPIT